MKARPFPHRDKSPINSSPSQTFPHGAIYRTSLRQDWTPPSIRVKVPCRDSPFSVLLLLASAAAQDASTGAIRGTVSDAAGARIPRRHHRTGESRHRHPLLRDQLTPRAVRPRTLLPPGDYLARAEAPGMSPQVTPAPACRSGRHQLKLNSSSPSPGVKGTIT